LNLINGIGGLLDGDVLAISQAGANLGLFCFESHSVFFQFVLAHIGSPYPNSHKV
jgi:hypothetical protein